MGHHAVTKSINEYTLSSILTLLWYYVCPLTRPRVRERKREKERERRREKERERAREKEREREI